MLKIHQNTFGGRAPSGPAVGERMRSTRPSSLNGDLLLRGETGGEGKRWKNGGKGEGDKARGRTTCISLYFLAHDSHRIRGRTSLQLLKTSVELFAISVG